MIAYEIEMALRSSMMLQCDIGEDWLGWPGAAKATREHQARILNNASWDQPYGVNHAQS